MASRKLATLKRVAKAYNASAECRDTDPTRSKKLFEESQRERAKLTKKPTKKRK